jgi:hypothetical protein
LSDSRFQILLALLEGECAEEVLEEVGSVRELPGWVQHTFSKKPKKFGRDSHLTASNPVSPGRLSMGLQFLIELL